MNLEVKQQWLEALRSGNYKQGFGAMHSVTPTGESVFCCLGVLCDIVDKTKWGLPQGDSIYSYDSVTKNYPPFFVQEKADLESEYLKYLAGLNDNGVSFAAIANQIEQRY